MNILSCVYVDYTVVTTVYVLYYTMYNIYILPSCRRWTTEVWRWYTMTIYGMVIH